MNKFAHHKKALYNFAFWTTITEGSQTITNYDRLLCEKGPISKQTSHDYFFRDIRYITAHFQEDRELIQHIKKLSKSVDNVKNDADNKHFWANLAPRLMAIHYEKPVAEGELKLAGMRKVADLLNKEQTKKRSNSSALETRNTKHRKDNEDKELKRIEHDGVFLTSSSISVGTTIKRKALELFREKQLNKMTPRERKLVTNGLSSILDLTDDSNLSQRSLFSKDEWNELKEKFGSELLPEHYGA